MFHHPNSPLPPKPSEAALRDGDIVGLLQQGANRLAFEQLLQRYEHKVFHLCVCMLGNAATAEDAAQDSFLRVWGALAGYDAQRGALSTWIYAITRNRCLTELGRRHLDTQSMDLPDLQEAVANVASPAPLNDRASLDMLRQLVDNLAPAHQTCLKLYYFEEQSVAVVAEMLGMPQGTVKTNLHRARNALHQLLASHGLASAALWL